MKKFVCIEPIYVKETCWFNNLGAHYIFPNSGTDLQLSWSHLQTMDTDSVTVNPASQWVSPFSQTGTPPTKDGDITGISLLKLADATLHFNYDAVNLDLGKYINFGSNLQTRLFTGLTSARIKEQLVSTFRGLPQPMLSINNTSSYQGVGPRIGLNNAYNVYHGINILGQLAGSILIGSMQPAEYKFTGNSAPLALVGINTDNEAIASASVAQFVPAVDAKLGLSYACHMVKGSTLTFELGYMGALYVNPLSSYETNTNVIPLDTGSLSTASVKHIQSNFSVAGPYVTASYKY